MAVGSRVMVSPDSDDVFTSHIDRRQTLAFKYVNKDLPMPDCVGVILAQKGKIVYCGVAGATAWHGSFESGVGGHRQGLILKFHRKGKQSWQ